MKRLSFKIYGLFILMGIVLLSSSMKPDTDCLGDVKRVFNAMNETVIKGNVCYIKYVITTNSNAEKGKSTVNESTFEMITSHSQSRLYGKEMIVLKDEKNTFSILPSRKVIYWADAVPSKKGEHLYDQLSLLQDSIFKNVKKQECTEVKDKPYDKVVTIDLNEKMSTFLGIRSASYYIDDAAHLLKKVIVHYLPGNQFERLEYDFKEIDLDYKKTDMTIPVKKIVFETDQKLQAAYQGFQIKDSRKK